MPRIDTTSHRILAAALLVVLSNATVAQAKHSSSLDDDDFDAVITDNAGLVVLGWFVFASSMVIIPVSLSYGIIGIMVAQSWPNPACCCYKSPFSGGDSGTPCLGCLPIYGTCVVMLVIQSISAVLNVIFTILHSEVLLQLYSLWWLNIVAFVVELVALAVLISAVVMLALAYKRHGQPKPARTPITAMQTMPVASNTPPLATSGF